MRCSDLYLSVLIPEVSQEPVQGYHATCKLLDVLDGSWGIQSHNSLDLLWISLDSSIADDESE